MALYYKLSQPNVTAISVDGIEHKVDPATGVVTIEMMTPNLIADLIGRGAVSIDSPTGEIQTAPKAETPARGAPRTGHAATPGATAPATAASTTKGPDTA